jgi:glycosyltransferase involved in cell wall biosynthesis
MKVQRPPTILIDATDIDKPSGGRTAVLELFRHVFAQEPGWRYLVLVSQPEPAFDLSPVRQIVVPFRHRVLERLWIQAVVSYFSLRRAVDIVHFARTMGGFARPAKSVLTVFDLTTLVHPEIHSRSAVWYWQHIAPLHLRWADRVLAISHDVASDLAKLAQVPPAKIDVMYCAPQSIFDEPIQPALVEAVRRRYDLPEAYLLFVGMLARKKNLSTLIRALHALQQQMRPTPFLVLAGRRYKQSDDSALLGEIEALGLQSNVRYLGPVDTDTLRGLYGGASALVFPSLHEGFGIPCLEAMKCGVPVVAARSGAVPEVVGNAALLVDDPLGAEALAESIRLVLEDATLRQELVARGLDRAKLFSWPHIAGQLLRLYRQFLEK